MKAEELRIGNYVLDEDREISKIEQISSDNIHKFTLVSGDAINIYPSNIYPIPLTEEILLKCGFVKNGNSHLLLNLDNGFNLSAYGYSFRNSKYEVILTDTINNELTIVKHLHQLQNLYSALNQEELKITL